MDLLGSLLVPFREENKATTTEVEAQQEVHLDKDPFTASQDVTAPAQDDSNKDATNTGPDLSKHYEVMSLDEYTAQTSRAAAQAAREAEIDSRIQSFEPAAKRDLAGSQERTPSSNGAGAVPLTPLPLNVRPVALGKPRTSDHIIALHHLTEKHKFPLPEYEYKENGVKGAGTFGARLIISVNAKNAPNVGGEAGEHAEVVVEDLGPFQSKKEAKAVISEKGLVALKEKLKEIENAQAEQAAAGTEVTPAAATRKIDPASAVAPADPNVVPGENPIGLLLGKQSDVEV